MAMVVGLAVWVILQAAVEPLRRGAQVLTPEGERLTDGARRRARVAAEGARRVAVDVRSNVTPQRGKGETSTEATDSAPDEDQVVSGDAPSAGVESAGVESAGHESAGVEVVLGADAQPPRQTSSPVATPATGVSETIAQ